MYMICGKPTIAASRTDALNNLPQRHPGADHPPVEPIPLSSFAPQSSRNVVFQQVSSPVRALLFCLDVTAPNPAVRPALVGLRTLGI
jgi:hypothetical protein